MTSKYVQMSRFKEFRSVSNLLNTQLFDTDDSPVGEHIQQQLVDRWPGCAGRAAIWSYPLLFRSGRLVVFTESAIWATELRHQKQAIEDGLIGLGIKQIIVRASPQVFPRKNTRIRKVNLSLGNSQNMSKTASKLEHEGLREAVIRLSRRGDDG
ncbi:MAG: DciA family protein [bacterium]